MAVSNITLDASQVGGAIIPGGAASRIQVPTTGRITVPAADVPALLRAGATYVGTVARSQTLAGAPRAASAGRIVASVALANGTLTIANQPDIPRMLGVRVDPGTVAITAGLAAVAYVGNDNVTRTENVSLATPASTIFTTNLSRGVQTVSSVIVTDLAGGASPVIQVNDTNALSVIVDSGFAGFAISQEFTDGVAVSGATVSSSAASITPTTTPNGTHTYGFSFGYTAPS